MKFRCSLEDYFGFQPYQHLCLGGHDDSKVMLPVTIVLRHMFTPAELRVGIFIVSSSYCNIIKMLLFSSFDT